MKKGFTLIELLGVIIILVAIALIAIPPLLKSINDNKDTISEANKKIIYSATDLYLSNNVNSFPRYEGSIYCVTLGTLVKSGTLDHRVYTEVAGEKYDNTKTVKITVNKGIFDKEIVNVNECNNHIIISIKNSDNKTIASYVGLSDSAVCSSSIDGEVITSDELTVGSHSILCDSDGTTVSFDAIVTEN